MIFTPSSYRLIFMGTPEFAVPSLNILLEEGYQMVAVYTQPPKPKGRGYTVSLSPIHQVAQKHLLPVLTPKTLKSSEEQEKFASFNAHLAIVIAYGLILPKTILESPSFGCVNVHASLLPRWRGASPIQRSLLEGDKETGITIMKMDEGLDTGPILKSRSCALTPATTTPFLHDQLAKIGADLLKETLPSYLTKTLHPIAQPKEGITYAPKLSKEEGKIDWTKPAVYIERQIRALNPWPSVWFDYNGHRFKVLEAEVVHLDNKPGLILDDSLTIACGDKALRILKIQKEGKAALSAKEFLHGTPFKKGFQLSN
ncbi:MAG: methionyl-tRNA formyltransferase [Proteobacteria bacterium]|nr:methionyl-tRNA formyltransferase [Pseudomonadota bacterium]